MTCYSIQKADGAYYAGMCNGAPYWSDEVGYAVRFSDRKLAEKRADHAIGADSLSVSVVEAPEPAFDPDNL